TEQMEKRVEAEAEKLEATAMQLCERLPGLLASQQALAAAVPEFAPYARMETSDIEDCSKEAESAGETGSFAGDAAAEADAAADSARSRHDPGRRLNRTPLRRIQVQHHCRGTHPWPTPPASPVSPPSRWRSPPTPPPPSPMTSAAIRRRGAWLWTSPARGR